MKNNNSEKCINKRAPGYMHANTTGFIKSILESHSF